MNDLVHRRGRGPSFDRLGFLSKVLFGCFLMMRLPLPLCGLGIARRGEPGQHQVRRLPTTITCSSRCSSGLPSFPGPRALGASSLRC